MLYNKLSPNIIAWNNKHLWSQIISVGTEIQGWLRKLVLRVSHKAIVKIFAGDRHLTLTWLVDVFPRWFAHRSWKLVLLVGKWSWSFTMWSSIGLLKCHHDMTSGDPRHSKLVAENVFYDPVLVATCHFSQYSIGFTGQSLLTREGITKSANIMNENHCGLCWRLSQMLTTT